jgi:hypothetical protein
VAAAAAEHILVQVAEAVSQWPTFAAEAGVGRTSKARIGAAIQATLTR